MNWGKSGSIIERHILHLMVAQTWQPDIFILKLTFLLLLKKIIQWNNFSDHPNYDAVTLDEGKFHCDANKLIWGWLALPTHSSKLQRSTLVWRKIPLRGNKLKWGSQALSTHSFKLRRSTLVGRKIPLPHKTKIATPHLYYMEWYITYTSQNIAYPLICDLLTQR